MSLQRAGDIFPYSEWLSELENHRGHTVQVEEMTDVLANKAIHFAVIDIFFPLQVMPTKL